MSAFKARYPGRCAACDEGIEVDDLLTYDADDTVIHAACQDSVNKARLKPVEVCPRCFMAKSVIGECGCES